MIDEQHRFGSAQREKIHSLNKQEFAPHFIQFSATPIPRTLSMIQSELLNFSFIKQMPFKKILQLIAYKMKVFLSLARRSKKKSLKIIKLSLFIPY